MTGCLSQTKEEGSPGDFPLVWLWLLQAKLATDILGTMVTVHRGGK